MGENLGDALGVMASHLNDDTGKKDWMNPDMREMLENRTDRMLSFVAKKVHFPANEELTNDAIKQAVAKIDFKESDREMINAALETPEMMEVLKNKIEQNMPGQAIVR